MLLSHNCDHHTHKIRFLPVSIAQSRNASFPPPAYLGCGGELAERPFCERLSTIAIIPHILRLIHRLFSHFELKMWCERLSVGFAQPSLSPQHHVVQSHAFLSFVRRVLTWRSSKRRNARLSRRSSCIHKSRVEAAAGLATKTGRVLNEMGDERGLRNSFEAPWSCPTNPDRSSLPSARLNEMSCLTISSINPIAN